MLISYFIIFFLLFIIISSLKVSNSNSILNSLLSISIVLSLINIFHFVLTIIDIELNLYLDILFIPFLYLTFGKSNLKITELKEHRYILLLNVALLVLVLSPYLFVTSPTLLDASMHSYFFKSYLISKSVLTNYWFGEMVISYPPGWDSIMLFFSLFSEKYMLESQYVLSRVLTILFGVLVYFVSLDLFKSKKIAFYNFFASFFVFGLRNKELLNGGFTHLLGFYLIVASFYFLFKKDWINLGIITIGFPIIHPEVYSYLVFMLVSYIYFNRKDSKIIFFILILSILFSIPYIMFTQDRATSDVIKFNEIEATKIQSYLYRLLTKMDYIPIFVGQYFTYLLFPLAVVVLKNVNDSKINVLLYSSVLLFLFSLSLDIKWMLPSVFVKIPLFYALDSQRYFSAIHVFLILLFGTVIDALKFSEKSLKLVFGFFTVYGLAFFFFLLYSHVVNHPLTNDQYVFMKEYLSRLDYDGYIKNVGLASYWIPSLSNKKVTHPSVLKNDHWIEPNDTEVDYLYLSSSDHNDCLSFNNRKARLVMVGENFCFAKFV